MNQQPLNGFVREILFVSIRLMHLYLLLNLACPNGSYGQDCTQTCNDKCDGCNNVNGSCDRRCKPGWKGDNCQQRNALTEHLFN